MLPSHTNSTGVHFLVVPSPMNAGHKQARVAQPVSATRGSQSALRCGLPGFEPSLSKNRRVASFPHTRVGCEDIRARVLLAICNHPSQIFQSDFLSCKRQIIQKKINIYVMRSQEQSRCSFYSKNFLVPKKGGGLCPIGPKAGSQVVQIQDANKSRSSVPRKLLYINRPLKYHILTFTFARLTGNSSSCGLGL